jgi:hypothetical protein
MPPKGGRATTAAIPGATLVTYPGTGHDLARPSGQRSSKRSASLSTVHFLNDDLR